MEKFYTVGLRLSCLAAVTLFCGHFNDSLAAPGSESTPLDNVTPGMPANSLPEDLNNVTPGMPANSLPEDLIAQIIKLKNSATAETSPEELGNIMGKIDDLERQLAILQGSLQPPVSSMPATQPDPSLPADPAQADLMAQIITLKNIVETSNSPDDIAAMMRKIEALQQQLAVLQSSPQVPTDPVPPPKPDPIPSTDLAQADLIKEIIGLKNTMAATTSPEEQAAIMRQIDDLNEQLSVLQSASQPPTDPVPPKPEPSPVDPKQAALIEQIIKLKNLMTTTTSPEEQAAIMQKIDVLTQQLAELQASTPPTGNVIPNPKPEPAQPLDPAQADFMAKIIKLKNALSVTSSTETQAALINEIQELEKQVALLQSSTPTQPALNATPPNKTEEGPTPDPARAATGGMANNKLFIVNNYRPVNAKPQGNLVTITWNGGPGIILQTSTTIGGAGWQDVRNTDGKSSVDLPLSSTGTFFRVIRR